MQKLSQREQEIFDALIAGTAPKEIGFNLNISLDTVRFHQKNIYQKLGVNSITELLTKYQPGSQPSLNTNNENPAVPEQSKPKSRLSKVLITPPSERMRAKVPLWIPTIAIAAAALLAAVGIFLFLKQPKTTALIELPLAEQPLPADFVLTLQDTDLGGEYFFEPDVFEYNGVSYASPFKLGEGNRLSEGDIYQVTCSFTPNVDLGFVHISFLDTGTQDEYGNWTELSGFTEFRDGFKANARHTFSTKILVTKTAGSVFPPENIFHFHADSPSGNTPELTFHEFEVRKISAMQPGVTASAQDLPSPLVITPEDTDVEDSHWSYSFSYTDFIQEGEIRPSPFKLGSGNRITEDDIYQISCTYTSNVDLDYLDIRFVDTTRGWINLSPIVQLQHYTKAGEETSVTLNLMATGTARGASPNANMIDMFTHKIGEEPPILTFTRFEIVKIN